MYVYLVLRSKINFFFDFHASLPILHGLPLAGTSFSDFAIFPNLFLVLPPLLAFAVGQIVARSLAFLGLFLLLRDFVLPRFREQTIVAAGASLLYALLPYWDDNVGTMAILPLISYALLSLAHGQRRMLSWTVVFFAPFLWNFALGGFVIVGVACIYALLLCWQRNPHWLSAVGAALWLVIVGAAVEYRTVYLLFFTDFVSHRSEWLPMTSGGITDLVVAFVKNVVFGQYHNHSGQFPIPLVAIVVALIVSVGQQARSTPDTPISEARVRLRSTFRMLLGLSLFISLIFSAEESGVTKFLFIFPVPFQISRVNILHPLLVQVMFAAAVGILCLEWPGKSKILAIVFFVGALFQGILTAHSLGPKVLRSLGVERCIVDVANCSQTEIGAYYRKDEFAAVAKSIGRSQSEYWVVSLGLDPLIAAFNGFQTIDGYAPMYSLKVKRQIEQIIGVELDRNKWLSDYFRKWGNRAYLFYEGGRPLAIDFCAALRAGAVYVLTPLDLNDPSLSLAATGGHIKAYEIRSDRCG